MKGTSKVAYPLFHEPQKMGENMRAKIILFGILILFFSLLIKTSPCIAKEASLTLIYTSNTLGEVESCGCPEAGDAGGLGEGLIILIRSERRSKTFLSSMEEMHWCSVFLIERARGKRRGGEQGWF